MVETWLGRFKQGNMVSKDACGRERTNRRITEERKAKLKKVWRDREPQAHSLLLDE